MKVVDYFAVIIYGIIILSLGIFWGANLQSVGYLNIEQNTKITDNYNNSSVDSCYEEVGLEHQMRCLNEHVNKIFKYTITSDFIDLSYDELVTRGGDCRDWANFYDGHARNMGYNVRKILIHQEYLSYHRFSVIYDDTGYCVMDMTIMGCVPYNIETFEMAGKK